MKAIPVASADLSGNEERYVVDALRSSWISSDRPVRRALRVRVRDALRYARGHRRRQRHAGAPPGAAHRRSPTGGRGPRPLADVRRHGERRPVLRRRAGLRGRRSRDLVHGPAARGGAHHAANEGHHPGPPLRPPRRHGRHQPHRGHARSVGGGGRRRVAPRALQGAPDGEPRDDRRLLVLREQGPHERRGRGDHARRSRARAPRAAAPRPGRGPGPPVLLPDHRLQLPADQRRVRDPVCAARARRAIVARRRAIYARYREKLTGVPGIGHQPIADWAEPSPWLFCITVDSGAYGRTRDELAAHLSRHGVDTRPFFIPVHVLPPYRKESTERGETLPVTDRLAATGLNLPTYTLMSDADVDRVADVVRQGAR